MLVMLSLCLLVLASGIQAQSSNKIKTDGVWQCIDNDALTTETLAAIENAIKVSQYGRQVEKIKALNRLEEHVANMRPIIMAEKIPEVNTFADCLELMESGTTQSGVYTITPIGTSVPVQVYCDMITDDGGWTVFQRRENGETDFERNFDDYAQGFGEPGEEFWLGNNALRSMTDPLLGSFKLRIDMWDWAGNHSYAEYSDFSITGDDFVLGIGEYAGDAGDSLTFHNGMGFTARDKDVDGASGGNCAVWLHGGWWYQYCHRANLNGRYLETDAEDGQRDQGIQWVAWKGFYYSLKKVEMKFKPVYNDY